MEIQGNVFWWIEAVAVVTGIIYLVQALRLKRNCWIYGGISTFLFAGIFYVSKLYVDGTLNVYYVAMAVVGWITWGRTSEEIPVTRLRIDYLAGITMVTALFAGALAFVMDSFTDTDSAVPDSVVGAFSVTATWLSTRKNIENWLFWIVANSVAIVLFLSKELYMTSAMMCVYLLLAIGGFVSWRKQLQHG